MFLSVYKTTLKNLFRSVVFWLMLALLIAVPLERAIGVVHSYLDLTTKEWIYDTDPRFVVSERLYLQNLDNNCGMTMLNIAPLFVIISTVLILRRDYGDGFYEIERAGGRKTWHYTLGRLAALFTVCFLAYLIVITFTCHWYVFTRGGVDGMSTGAYLWDSTVRTLRRMVTMDWPVIAMLVCFTYAVGSLLKSGIAASIVGCGYVLLNFLFNYQLRFRIPTWYNAFFSTTPRELRHYIAYYDSQWFEKHLETYNATLEKALIAFAILIVTTAVWYVISHLRIRHRET